MTQLHFYEEVEDSRLKFAVIIARMDGKYIFCRHRERNTWEVPGGHREIGEDILDTAKRELYEETGASSFTIEKICVYSVEKETEFDGKETYGMLYFAEISDLEMALHSEIEQIMQSDCYPEEWTYPDIMPRLMEEAKKRGFI